MIVEELDCMVVSCTSKSYGRTRPTIILGNIYVARATAKLIYYIFKVKTFQSYMYVLLSNYSPGNSLYTVHGLGFKTQ
jgi:hypothetical protein